MIGQDSLLGGGRAPKSKAAVPAGSEGPPRALGRAVALPVPIYREGDRHTF